MAFHVTINKKIIVNQREYKSVEEMPGDIRAVYEKAMAVAGGAGQGISMKSPNQNIFVNGREYKNLEDMPPQIRRIYEGAVAAIDTGQNPGTNAWRGSEGVPPTIGEGSKFSFCLSPVKFEIEASSLGSKVLIGGGVILILLAFFFFS